MNERSGPRRPQPKDNEPQPDFTKQEVIDELIKLFRETSKEDVKAIAGIGLLLSLK